MADVRGAELVLADALAVLRVVLDEPCAAQPGDLVVVEGARSKSGDGVRLQSARIVERHRPLREPFAGEAARLAGGRGRRLAARSRTLAALRRHLDAEGFLEVDTPLRARTATLDVHIASLPSEDRWLVTSPELPMKRLLAGGLPRIYQLGHCFRAGEKGALHEPEFLMLEWYRAFAGSREVMEDTERLVELAFAAAADTGGSSPATLDVRPPYPRVSVREAFRAHAGVADAFDLAESDEARYYELLGTRVEPGLARLPHPVFLVEFPSVHAALARALPANPRAADRFELYAAGVELCNGFGELTDAAEQRRRFEGDRAARRARGLPVPDVDERFLEALEGGMPPSGGNALGVDRLLMLASGTRAIADVMPFPHDDV